MTGQGGWGFRNWKKKSLCSAWKPLLSVIISNNTGACTKSLWLLSAGVPLPSIIPLIYFHCVGNQGQWVFSSLFFCFLFLSPLLTLLLIDLKLSVLLPPTLSWVLVFGLVIAGSSFPVKKLSLWYFSRWEIAHVCFLFCLRCREDFACKDSGGRREEVNACNSLPMTKLIVSYLSAFFFNGLSLLLSSLSAGEQDSVNSALDGSSGSDTICHLIHFQGRGWRLCACVCTHALPT